MQNVLISVLSCIEKAPKGSRKLMIEKEKTHLATSEYQLEVFMDKKVKG